ncbi:hypothetical protein EB75_16680 [Mycobacterium sp. ST-F2]|uniref:hypothetical protein n=1 Tax=Mycobacterium sp. ST-F2 TaxID=1490484 RepID=UPI00093BABF3|nr:hypothetical protein [Mycobacterium sp. ST-F2]OKH81523.1 hypothetical protein EB75_16680 [Mycobacterium sp. ST-F2]
MLKKVVIAALAAGAVSIPLAGLSGADTTPDNPGVPGAIGGAAPGDYIHQAAQGIPGPTSKAFGVPPGQIVKWIARNH